MKKNKHIKFAPAAILLAVLLLSQSAEANASDNRMAPEDFPALNAFGEWLNVAPHGLCWKPSVISAWKPFEFGRWVWTDSGMTWLSYEPFGWIVHHYGYWTNDPAKGWIWIPATDWSPARVTWIRFGQTIGWAPIPPPGAPVADPWEPSENRIWNFVSADKLDRDDVRVFVSKSAPARPNEPGAIARTAPDKSSVLAAEAILRNERKLSRIEFPVSLNNRLAAQRANVSRNVLRPTGKQGNASAAKQRRLETKIH